MTIIICGGLGYMALRKPSKPKIGGITLTGDTKIPVIRKYVAETDPYRVSFNTQSGRGKAPAFASATSESKSTSGSTFVFNFNTMDNENKFSQLEKFIDYVDLNADTSDTVIIRIKSPGGLAYMFEEAYTKLHRLKARGLNVIASVDSMCASGGYMVACACKKIVASKTALIGSIGVIMQAMNYKDLADKIGLKFLTFASSEHKGAFPGGTEYTEEDIAKANSEISKTMDMFSDIVKSNRTVSEDVFTAKVWYAEEAKRLGLVDDICTYNDLISSLGTSDIYICASEEHGFIDKLKTIL